MTFRATERFNGTNSLSGTTQLTPSDGKLSRSHTLKSSSHLTPGFSSTDPFKGTVDLSRSSLPSETVGFNSSLQATNTDLFRETDVGKSSLTFSLTHGLSRTDQVSGSIRLSPSDRLIRSDLLGPSSLQTFSVPYSGSLGLTKTAVPSGSIVMSCNGHCSIHNLPCVHDSCG
jgi:hypothetical protein